MARSFSNVKILSALVSDGFAKVLARRGFASAATGDQAAQRSGSVVKKEESTVSSTVESWWVPDPVTGYYRPENSANVIDVAELRAMLRKKKN